MVNIYLTLPLVVLAMVKILAGNSPDSDGPQGPNITLGGNLGNWTFEDFALALRGRANS